MTGNFLAGDFLAHAVPFGDSMAGNFLVGDFLGGYPFVYISKWEKRLFVTAQKNGGKFYYEKHVSFITAHVRLYLYILYMKSRMPIKFSDIMLHKIEIQAIRFRFRHRTYMAL